MISECLSAPAGSGVYVEQVVIECHQEIDFDRFSRSWLMLVQDLDFFRMGFAPSGRHRYETISTPIQELNIETLDWSQNPSQGAEEFLNAFILADRRLGFSPFASPLFRIALLKLAPARYTCIFSYFAALADQKRLAEILRGFFAAYGQETLLPPVAQVKPLCRTQKQPSKTGSDKFAPEFWQHQLRHVTTPLSLPFSLAKPRVKQDRRNRKETPLTTLTHRQTLSSEHTRKLRSFCKKHQLQLQCLLAGAFAVALSHYSGEEQIFFCIQTDETRTGAASDFGNQTNLLPAVFSVNPKDRLAHFLAHIQTRINETGAARWSTLGDIRAQISGTDGTELFDIAFSFEEHCVEPDIQPYMETIACQNLSVLKRTPFSLFLSICGTDQLTVNFHFDRRRFDEKTITSMLGHLWTWLSRATDHDNPTLSEIPILSEQDKKQIAGQLNPTSMPPKPDACLHHLFEIQASANRKSEAVSTQTTWLTYGQVDDRAGQIAHYLVRFGAKPGDKILIFLEPDPSLITAQLGVLKAGCIAIPICLARFANDLAEHLDILRPDFAITSSSWHAGLRVPEERTIVLDAAGQKMDTLPSMHPNLSVSPDSLSYILADRNGPQISNWVMIAHSSLVSHVRSAMDIYEILPTDRLLLTGEMGSAAFTAQIFLSLYAGAALAVPPWPESPSPADLMAYCQDQEITVLILSQGDWQGVLTDPGVDIPESVRLVIIENFRYETDFFDRWHQRFPSEVRADIRRFATYGTTETTGAAFWTDLSDARDANARRHFPLGSPFPGICLSLVNRFGQPALHHTRGELVVGGVQIASGYYHNTDKNDESFGEIECSGGTLWGFKTGDHARWIPGSGLVLERQNQIRSVETLSAPYPNTPYPNTPYPNTPYPNTPSPRQGQHQQGLPTIVLVGNSARAALSYKNADLKGHRFYHAPIFIHFYDASGQTRTDLAVPDIAEKCIGNLQKYHPDGPYILIGECQNAVVAHEAAIQFKQRGVDVKMLIIIDENWQAQPPVPPAGIPHAFFSKQLAEMKTQGWGYIFHKIKKRLGHEWYKAYSSLDTAREAFCRLAGLPVPEALQYRKMEEVYYRACEKHPYAPHSYDGKTLLLYSEDWQTRFQPQLNRYYTGSVRRVSYPITHSDWFKPEQINLILEEIRHG